MHIHITGKWVLLFFRTLVDEYYYDVSTNCFTVLIIIVYLQQDNNQNKNLN